MARGQPKPITWKALERQVRRACKDAGLQDSVSVTPWTPTEERNAAARDHAYVYPDRLDFRFSSKVLALPEEHREAIVAHEVGHCLAQKHWNSSTEPEADEAARIWLGTPICYDHSWPGKGLQVMCSRARATNPSDFVAPTSSTESEPGHVYHATNTDNLEEIVASGKLIPHGPSYGTDQSEWPDGSRQKRSYWSARAGAVWAFAPEQGRAAILRTARTPDFKNESGTGDVYTTKPVPVARLEVLTEEGWIPLSRVSNPRKNPARATNPVPEGLHDAILQMVRSDDAKTILKENGVDGFGIGGCWAFAVAFMSWSGRGEEVAVDLTPSRVAGMHSHVLVRDDDIYYDWLGAHTKDEVLRWWRTRDRPPGTRAPKAKIVPFEYSKTQAGHHMILCPASLVGDTIDLMNRWLGSPRRWWTNTQRKNPARAHRLARRIGG